MDEEIKAQGAYITCSRLHSQSEAEPEFEPRQSGSRKCSLNFMLPTLALDFGQKELSGSVES